MNTQTDFVYIINQQGTNRYKIGVTKDIKRRLRQLQTGCSDKLLLIKCFDFASTKTCTKAAIRSYDVERTLHQYYKEKGKHIHLEWFNLSSDECHQLCRLLDKMLKKWQS